MLVHNKEKISSWKDLKAGWYDFKTPAMNPALIDLWLGLADELESRFPDCAIFIVPTSGSDIGLDFHKLMPGGKWSEEMTSVFMPDVNNMQLGDGDDEVFDREKMFKHLEDFRSNVKVIPDII